MALGGIGRYRVPLNFHDMLQVFVVETVWEIHARNASFSETLIFKAQKVKGFVLFLGSQTCQTMIFQFPIYLELRVQLADILANWEVGSKYIRNWKIREKINTLFVLIRG